MPFYSMPINKQLADKILYINDNDDKLIQQH